MNSKIRIGNDIDIRWSLFDESKNPYILTGRNIAVELNVGTKRIRMQDIEVDGNTMHFIFHGKDQKYVGSYILKYIENEKEVDMVTFDTKDAFELVDHSWQAIDEGETPETIQIEVVTVSSELDSKVGPRGYSAYEIAVQNGFIGTEEEWLASLVGPPGPGATYLDAYFNVVQGDDEQVMLTYDHGEVTKARLDEIIGEGGIPCLNMYFNEAGEGDTPIWAFLGKAVYDGRQEDADAFRAGNSFLYDLSVLFVEENDNISGYGYIAYYAIQNIVNAALQPIEEKIPEEASSSNKLADKAYVDTKYTKPASGIPKADLASGVQTELEHGQSAYGSVSTINEKIPDAASHNNKLADKAWVESLAQYMNATFQGNWANWAAIPSTASGFDSEPDNNDYIVVMDASGYASEWNTEELSYVVGDVRMGRYSHEFYLYGCIAAVTYEEEETPSSPADDPEHWERVQSNPAYAGTWFFKYAYPDPEEDYNKKHWVPEFKISDVPFTQAQMDAINSGITAGKIQSGTTSSNPLVNKTYVDGKVSPIEEKIPAQASPSNQLADKNFVNSTVHTETATFRNNWRTWGSVPSDADGFPEEGLYSGPPNKNDYLVVRDASGYAPTFDQLPELPTVSVGDIVNAPTGDHQTDELWRCIQEYNYDDIDIRPETDTEHEYWERVAQNPAYEGTWRFKYIVDGSVEYDKYYWQPEYQVNEKPLTAAQLAALNSNITEALTNKLVALPTKPVDTAAQSLSDAEKAQARANIGITPVTSWNNPPLDTNIPAEKLVYDSMFVRGVISQKQTWTGNDNTGYDYTISNVVWGNIPKSFIEQVESYGVVFNAVSGYFEFNGLMDLTYQDMLNVIKYNLENQANVAGYRILARTNLPGRGIPNYPQYYTWTASSFCYSSEPLEVLCLRADGTDFYISSNVIFLLGSCRHMKKVIGVMNVSTSSAFHGGAFENNNSLEDIQIKGAKASFSIKNSPRLSVASILYMINNEVATSPIVITLHATAYARATADADIQTALTNHPNVSLASA